MKHTKINRTGGGFILIELLIVVTVISPLAVIAVPNFLEAQVRADPCEVSPLLSFRPRRHVIVARERESGGSFS